MYKFEGKFVDNKNWFDFDFNRIDTNFNTRETEFYKSIFQPYV